MRKEYLVLLLFGALVAGALLAGWLGRFWRRLRFTRRRSRGRQGELEAPAVLRAAGYTVLDDQANLEGCLEVDGRKHTYDVRADFLVARGQQRYVAEVKTGEKAPDPVHSATRRQLLEYRVLYDVDGVLLVDMEREEIRRVEWPALGQARPADRGRLRAIMTGLGAGLLFGLALGFWLASR